MKIKHQKTLSLHQNGSLKAAGTHQKHLQQKRYHVSGRGCGSQYREHKLKARIVILEVPVEGARLKCICKSVISCAERSNK